MTITITQQVPTDLVEGYDDRGAATADDPTLLFLPGWCGSRGVFDGVAEAASRTHRALSMDLPQHGTRPRTGEDFDTAEAVEDAISLLDACGVDRVVPVTLSHAGWVALELRRRLGPDRVPAVVLVDWMVQGPPPGFVDALRGLQDPQAWSGVRAGLFSMWVSGLGLDLPAVHEYVADMGTYGASYWQTAGREIATAFAAEGSPLAMLERLPEPCLTLHLYAQPADDAVLAAQQEYADAHPWFEVHRLEARSHFPMLEVPGEMVTMIEEFTCRRA